MFLSFSLAWSLTLLAPRWAEAAGSALGPCKTLRALLAAPRTLSLAIPCIWFLRF